MRRFSQETGWRGGSRNQTSSMPAILKRETGSSMTINLRAEAKLKGLPYSRSHG
jgi:hypothetical protein